MSFRATSARPGPRPARSTRWTASLAVITFVGAGLVASGAAGAPASATTGSTAAATVEPVASTVLATADDLPDKAHQVALTDDNLFVQTGTGDAAVTYWRPRAGGDWSTIWGDHELAGELIAAENDVVHLRTPQGETLAWTRDHDGDGAGGGHRAVPEGSVLGHGARYMAYVDGGLRVHVQDVASAKDVWTNSWGQAGVGVHGEDVVVALARLGGTSVLRQRLGAGYDGTTGLRCTNGSDAATRVVDVAERFVLVRCADGEVWLQDAARVYRPFHLSSAYAADGLRLGEGFVLGTDAGTGELVVTPLADGTRGTLGTASDADLDDAGRTVVLVDPAGDVRTADLSDWSSPMRTVPEDVVPPTANAWPPTKPVVTTEYPVVLYATDPDNAPTYFPAHIALIESQQQVRAKGAATPGPWTPGPTARPATPGPTYRDEVRPPTPARGSEVCWRARATDTAGNVGEWSAARCVVVESSAPVVTAPQLPPSTRATGTSTKITFRYQATDNGKVASYDVRWRRTPRGGETGAWVYPKSYQGTTATSASAYSAKSTVTCFQVRARDVLGNVSGWSTLRCTYVDGTRPTIRWTSYPRWVTPSQTWWSSAEAMMVSKPSFTYGASDERGVVGYEVQRHFWDLGDSGVWAPRAVTGTKVSFRLYTSEQNCNRVRAKDQAGNWSAWSGWKCTNLPFDRSDAHVYGGERTGRYSYVLDGYTGAVESNSTTSARAIRAKFLTGPDYGSVRVSVGSRSFGVVHTWAPKPGMKWVTLRAPELARGYIRFTHIGIPRRDVHLREFYAVR